MKNWNFSLLKIAVDEKYNTETWDHLFSVPISLESKQPPHQFVYLLHRFVFVPPFWINIAPHSRASYSAHIPWLFMFPFSITSPSSAPKIYLRDLHAVLVSSLSNRLQFPSFFSLVHGFHRISECIQNGYHICRTTHPIINATLQCLSFH